MKDFAGNDLKVDDTVVFVSPYRPDLVRGYILKIQDDYIKVKFWVGTEWDVLELNSKKVCKIN